MRLVLAAVLGSLLLAAPALAKSHGEIISGDSLYASAATTPPDKIQALCDKIIANQTKGKTGMTDAGQLYFQGKLMGKSCVKIDYGKALALTHKAGDTVMFNSFVRLLRDRAGSNPAAARALAQFHIAP